MLRIKGPGGRCDLAGRRPALTALLVSLVAAPAALAAGPLGSLSQLPSPNNCIETVTPGSDTRLRDDVDREPF